jgi:hypothetical protein
MEMTTTSGIRVLDGKRLLYQYPWKAWGLQYFKAISSMKKHFNKENFQKFTKFSSRILTKIVLKDSLVSKDAKFSMMFL